MQHYPVQSAHLGGSVRTLPQPLPPPFVSPGQHYQLVEVAHPLLPQQLTQPLPLLSPNQTIYQSLPSPTGGSILVPIHELQSPHHHHILQTDSGSQVLISQEMVSPLSVPIPLGAHLQLPHALPTAGGTMASPLQAQQLQQQQHTNTVHTNVQIAPQPSLLPQPTTLLVHHSSPTGHLLQPQQSHHLPAPLQSSPPQQPQQQFLVVNDTVNGAEMVEFTDAGTQTILSALSQGETPAISINGDIVGYVNCAEIKSDGAIVFTIGGSAQPKSDISNFLELIDKKQSQRDAQSWFFDSVVATQAMQALISKRPDITPTLPNNGGAVRRQVH